MSIDNSGKIESFLSFDKDDFYFVQVIKRRKDNPDMKVGTATLKNYYINSIEEYYKLLPHIKKFCDMENARAYIRLNKRNYTRLGLKMISRAVEYIASDNCKSLRNLFDSVAGDYHSDPIKKWIIDIDSETIGTEIKFIEENGELRFESGASQIVRINSYATMLQGKTKNIPMGILLPTKNGIHIITRPFNLAEFKKEYPKVDVHKDACTILYCP